MSPLLKEAEELVAIMAASYISASRDLKRPRESAVRDQKSEIRNQK
jgi:hypothetical protein